MEQLLSRIAQVESDVIEDILQAVCTRYAAIFPDWELHIVSLHRKGGEIQQIDDMILFLEGLKTNYLQK